MKRNPSTGLFEIKRQLSNTPSPDTDIIIYHILEFFLYALESTTHQLPATQEELAYCLTQAQLYKVSLRVDPTVIFYHLLFNRVILIDTDYVISRNPTYDTTLPLLGFVPIDSDKEQFSTNFTRALNNTINWIISGARVPAELEAFYMALEKFCVFNCEANLCVILANLLQKQYIVPRCGGGLEYCLPKNIQHATLIYEGVPLSLTT